MLQSGWEGRGGRRRRLGEGCGTKRGQGRACAGRVDGLRRSCSEGLSLSSSLSSSGRRGAGGSGEKWAVAEEKQSGCRMQDGVRCVISERERTAVLV